MFSNHLATTFRYLKNNKVFSLINLAGLAIGMTACFFALLYVNFELSYDSFHENSERIYRLVTDVRTPNGIEYRSSSAPMAPAIAETFPEVKAVTRLLLDYIILKKDQTHFAEEKIAYADSSLFSVFTFQLVRGKPSTVLNYPFDLVLSETAARKYFGTDDAVGKILLVNGKEEAHVTGIMKDMPYNSHFRVDVLVSTSTLFQVWNPGMGQSWTSFRCYTYLLLSGETDVSRLAASLTNWIKKHIDRPQEEYTLLLEPLRDIYLHGKARGARSGSAVTGNIDNVYIFSLIAAFVLFIACFNFINLTTAFSIQRAKEIVVRKVLGASRKELVIQFLTDAVLLCLVAFVLTLLLVSLLTPAFNQLSGKMIDTTFIGHFDVVVLLFFLATAIGLLSGLYPAFFLSGLNSLDNFKGRSNTGRSGAVLRKILVVAQFSISVILVIATAVVFLQLDFMKNQELGFKKDHKLVIDFQFDNRVTEHLTTIKHELGILPGVQMISVSSCVPGRANHKIDSEIENVDGVMQEIRLNAYFIDQDFLKQYGIGIASGRPFSSEIESDTTSALMINEAAAKVLGFTKPEDAIGKKFSQWGRDGQIIGVIKNFHYQSFREEVQPLTMQMGAIQTFLTLDISSQNLPSIIKLIEKKWQEIVPGLPLTYFFEDSDYNTQYNSEERFGSLFVCFTTLAIFISCLGLFGLSAFSAAQRTKEIGVRKVLGASAAGIAGLLTRDYLKLIVVAMAIGFPIATLGLRQWLERFAYKIDLPLWVYPFAGVLVILVALVTIGSQTLVAANKNPVISLRTE